MSAAASNGRFAGRTALVTGATRHTGLAIAEAFVREGARVFLNGRNPDDVAREAARLRRQYNGDVVEAAADLSRQEAIDALFARVESEGGRLDVLVNNAVDQGVGHAFTETPRDWLEAVFRVNVLGTFACSQGAARIMLRQRSGAIVNLGSNTAVRALRNRSAYVASKGAVEALTRAMAVELGSAGIRVNLVVAGYIRTTRWDHLAPGVAERRRANIPGGREATGEEIAESVLFLASAAARSINGASLVVDGGSSAQLYPADADQ